MRSLPRARGNRNRNNRATVSGEAHPRGLDWFFLTGEVPGPDPSNLFWPCPDGPEETFATCSSLTHHLARELQDFGLPVEIVDARHLNAFLSIKVNKTDQNDARGIGEAMRCGAYKKVNLKADESVQVQAAVNLREALVEVRVKLSNSLRGILKPLGVRSLGSSVSMELFTERAKEAIADLPEAVKLGCEPLFESLKQIAQSINDLDKQLDRLVLGDPQVQLLMSAPGVGPIVALRFRHAIDDVSRFSNPKAIGAYLGLTPTQYSSGETCRQGRVSKCGSKRVRRALFEAASVLLTRTKSWCKLKALGLKLSQKKGFKKAVVAVARKLAVILYKMLVTGEPFKFGKPKTVALA